MAYYVSIMVVLVLVLVLFCTLLTNCLGPYIIVATDAKSAGSLQGHFIFRVTGFDILPLKDYRFKDPAEETYIRILKSNVRAAELYFSQTWDLTNA